MSLQSIDIDRESELLKAKIIEQEAHIKKLASSQQKYKDLFNASCDSKFIIDEKGNILEVNESACQKFGYSFNEYSSINIEEMFLKKNISDSIELVSTVIKQKSITLESNFVTRQDKIIPVEINAWYITLNEVNSILISVRDLSKLKKYQKQIEHEKDLFQTLMDNIPDRIYFKNNKSKFTLINKAQCKNLNLENSSQAIGLSDHDFFDKKHADDALNDEKEIVASQKSIISKLEYEKVQLPNRSYEWVNTTKIPIINKDGIVTGIVGISRDVTKLKSAENKILKYSKELQYLNASKDKFISILAHDLKNPFFSLLGYAEMLDSNYESLSEKEKQEYIHNIINISKSSYQLLENLLKWASSQNGRIEYHPQTFNLSQLLSDVVDLIIPIANKKNIAITNNVKNALSVYADDNMIRTVIRNLITNSIKFSDVGGNVILSTEETNDHILIIVQDNGIGMDTSSLDKIFSIDENHKSLGTSNEEGTGLGLILCKEFVEKNGGEISVQSRCNEGSKFEFTVPKCC